MGRSNTLPPNTPNRYDSKSSRKGPPRSATIQAQPPSRSKHHTPLRLPHNPFHHSTHSNASQPSSRPGVVDRQNSMHTRYMNMLLDLDTIPRLHNILASFFTWFLLAGFIIFPGTFTSLSSLTDDPALEDNHAASQILKRVKHVSLLYVAAFCSGIGGLGMIWLWYRWRANFVWLLNRIFLPGCLNSLAGLISTLVQVYGQQQGHWSVTAWITAAVTGGCMVITGVLFGVYNFWVLEKVKKRHGRDMLARQNTGDAEEGFVEKIERKANEPGLEPGSVV